MLRTPEVSGSINLVPAGVTAKCYDKYEIQKQFHEDKKIGEKEAHAMQLTDYFRCNIVIKFFFSSA